MILIGQYDSPFVRRVGIALRLYGMPFDHEPWSTFGDAEKVRRYNPLGRVPTLVLDDGEVLIESHAILDYLDGVVGPEAALFPRAEPERRRALKVAALGTGIADKAVSLFYEQRLHDRASDVWVSRCHAQIHGAMRLLEADLGGRTSAWWFGARMGHADVSVAAALRFVREAHPGLVAWSDYPRLDGHAAQCEALPVFQEIAQAFIPPA
jgi:glutathione S-transferase